MINKMDNKKLNITSEQAVKILNEALEADSVAINQMFSHRVACSERLANHATIQVRDYQRDGDPSIPNIGVLGLINGIFGISLDGCGYIQTEIDEMNEIVRFSVNSEEVL